MQKRPKVTGVYTVEDAVDYIGVGPFQIILTILTGLISVGRMFEPRAGAAVAVMHNCK